ncbi:GNAT family N-acetyltransferase [Mariprofundus ferrinatatus]|nr:GNAT family N-acetyltransferase [Mariprofundus ferrinatatus]
MEEVRSIRYAVRQANAGDAEAISVVGSTTFARAYGAIVRPEDMAEYLERMFDPLQIALEIKHSRAIYFVAEDEKQVLGYAKLMVTTTPRLLPDKGFIELVRLYVDANHYGKGIGERLLSAARSKAVASGYSGWWLRVWEKNEGAIRFYQHHGFATVGSEPYLIGETANPVALMFEALQS